MNEKLMDTVEKLHDEKFEWLEQREKRQKNDGEIFDINMETDLWYLMKIAELQILTEQTAIHAVI